MTREEKLIHYIWIFIVFAMLIAGAIGGFLIFGAFGGILLSLLIVPTCIYVLSGLIWLLK